MAGKEDHIFVCVQDLLQLFIPVQIRPVGPLGVVGQKRCMTKDDPPWSALFVQTGFQPPELRFLREQKFPPMGHTIQPQDFGFPTMNCPGAAAVHRGRIGLTSQQPLCQRLIITDLTADHWTGGAGIVMVSGDSQNRRIRQNLRDAGVHTRPLLRGTVIDQVTRKQNQIRVAPHPQSLPHLPGLFAQVQITHCKDSHKPSKPSCRRTLLPVRHSDILFVPACRL